MKVLLTGATGFVGRSLTLRLLRDGHEVVASVRSRERAAGTLEPAVELISAADEEALIAALESCDAVVNLAGEPVLGGRWTAARREALVDSRVGLTRRLVAAMRESSRPNVLVSASAVGLYGDSGDRDLDEDGPAANDFLARLCADWEEAALEAQEHGVRVAALRIGIVLGPEGGALAQMLPPFRMGAGGRIGNGRQWMSWIHMSDLVDLIVAALTDERYSGPINAVSPNPVRNVDFTRALGRALGRPTILPVPSVALRVLFGDAAEVLLGGQRVRPSAALERGFEFAFSDVDAALADILRGGDVDVGPSDAAPEHPYLEKRRPTYMLSAATTLAAPIDRVFDFFSRPENLGVITPPNMSFEMLTAPPTQDAMAAGVEIDYAIRLGPVPLRWRTRIEVFERGRGFVDSQLRGPYRCWWHEHTFVADGDRTLMEDRVLYAPPLGILGRLANALFVAPMLRRIFRYRSDSVRLRFGTIPTPTT